MRTRTKLMKAGTIALLIMMLFHANPIRAEFNVPPAVFLDGQQLSFQAHPVIDNGHTFVPLRTIFEAQGAEVSWDPSTRTVTALKAGDTYTYRIGDKIAHRNQEQLSLPVPGKIKDGFTMVPLRFVSEELGNLVKWHPYSHSITISSSTDYENEIEYGVNLRVSPDTRPETQIVRMLPKGERIHVIREIDADWLEVQTRDNTIGFISAKPKFTDYTSLSLSEKQADAIIAYGSQYMGTPYEFGASSDQTATFDCSSFVRHVFQTVLSVDLPRVSYQQAEEGTLIEMDDLRKGDLLFFSARGLDIGHVGIYAGEDKILHTYSKELGVHLGDFDEKWEKRFVKARRLF